MQTASWSPGSGGAPLKIVLGNDFGSGAADWPTGGADLVGSLMIEVVGHPLPRYQLGRWTLDITIDQLGLTVSAINAIG